MQNISELVLEKLTGWVVSFFVMLPNLAAAVLIVLGFAWGARVIKRILQRILQRVSTYAQVNRLLGTIGYIITLAVGVFIALGVLDLDRTVTSLLAGAGIIGLALGFAFQDIATNFIAGILLSVRRPFTEGDLVGTNDYFGTVTEVNLRSTRLRLPQGEDVILPNKEVFQNPLVNYSLTDRRRVDLECGVAYGDDLEEARRVAIDAITELEARDSSRPVECYFKEFGGSSVNFVLRYWTECTSQGEYLQAQSEGIMQLKQAFDTHGLTIPFPIQTLDFGVVGGEKLAQVLPQKWYEGELSED